jgi:hypothetical protein
MKSPAVAAEISTGRRSPELPTLNEAMRFSLSPRG